MELPRDPSEFRTIEARRYRASLALSIMGTEAVKRMATSNALRTVMVETQKDAGSPVMTETGWVKILDGDDVLMDTNAYSHLGEEIFREDVNMMITLAEQQHFGMHHA